MRKLLQNKRDGEYLFEQISIVNLNTIYKGLSKLLIIDVSLDREKDNPQLIFESLNSTGLELTQADLIRNYILMGLEKQRQEDIYENYWHPIEKSFGHSEDSNLFDRFLRDYLTIKIGRIPTIKEIYVEFKKYSSGFSDIKDLVVDIFEYSKYFVNIALEKELNKEIRELFADINELKVDVSYPFILEVYKDFIDKKISQEDFIEILKLVESYVFRRVVCGIPTNSLNKTFLTLYKKINQDEYLKSLKATFVLLDSYRRIPSNEEFTKELLIKDVYNFRNRNYLLKKLENYERKELVDIDSYTIEHIMPQNQKLSGEWIKDLGTNWKEVQKNYIHTIGNLTLTGYNSELSDRPFKDKQSIPGGFKDSPLRLNKYLAMIQIWNEEEIIKRGKELANKATLIWKYPDVSAETLEKYKLGESEEEDEHNYSIDDYQFLQEGEEMSPLFKKLRKKILNLDPSIKEEPQRYHITYKSDNHFVHVSPQEKALRLSLSIPFERIKDPQERCRDITYVKKWGNVEAKIKTDEDLDYGFNLIKQSFDFNIEFENGN